MSCGNFSIVKLTLFRSYGDDDRLLLLSSVDCSTISTLQKDLFHHLKLSSFFHQHVLQKVKRELDLAFPESWADLIAVAGAAAVAECDGPVIPITLSRLDSFGVDPEGKMPEETVQVILSKRFNLRASRACSTFWSVHNRKEGIWNPNLFDNSYFQILLQKPWKIAGPNDGMTSMIGLATDRALADDEECLKWLKVYAADQGCFFTDFAAVYTKLVNTGARWAPICRLRSRASVGIIYCTSFSTWRRCQSSRRM